jgi:hypothetical protein
MFPLSIVKFPDEEGLKAFQTLTMSLPLNGTKYYLNYGVSLA